jgi:chromosomal replication initiator protein
MTNEEIWNIVLGEMKVTVTPANFATWFKDTKFEMNGKEGIILVPSNFVKEWLQSKYHKNILKSVVKFQPQIKELSYKIDTNAFKKATLETKKASKKKEQEDISIEESSLPEITLDPETNLNPKYTFESLIVGSHNELAHATAQAVAKNVGTKYNPLFIYGGVGLGKTHLLQAIGNQIKSDKGSKGRIIRYMSMEKFTNDLVNALRQQTIDAFKEAYKKIDVLLIDDIQFITGKEKTQEELFHIFNTLYERNKQIAFTSDRPPKAIPYLEDRLRSRFEGGMIVDISLPDLETRIAILKMKAQRKNIAFSDDVYNYIAQAIPRNIRELEGALNRVIAYCQLKNIEPTVEDVKKILGNILTIPNRTIGFNDIVREVAMFYNVPKEEILKRSRCQDIVKPRQIIMYLMREEMKSSYPYIAEKLNKKDHTTIIYACNKITQEIKKDINLDREVTTLRENLRKV